MRCFRAIIGGRIKHRESPRWKSCSFACVFIARQDMPIDTRYPEAAVLVPITADEPKWR